MIKKLSISLGLSASLILAGCTAMSTSVEHRNLSVQTKTSNSIFIDPVAKEKQVVYVQYRNTSGVSDFDLQQPIVKAVQASGYQVTDDVAKANFLLQANTIKVGTIDPDDVSTVESSAFGSSISGAVVGGAAGSLVGGDNEAVGGALLGAAIGTIADAYYKSVSYAAITDIQLSQRVAEGTLVRDKGDSEVKQGTSSFQQVMENNSPDWQRFQTRVVTVANKVNLELKDALPEMEDAQANAVGGFF